jgi:syntaxin-binding protein 1
MVELGELTYRSVDKVRIIALYILFREGVADEDRRRLFQHARLSISEQDSINNLVFLGAKVIKVSWSRPTASATYVGAIDSGKS